MLRFALLSLSALIVGTLFMELMSSHPGYVLIHIFNTTFEASFWFMLTCIAVAGLFGWYTWKLIRKILGSFWGGWSWISESRNKRADMKTNSGLVHFIEGNWREAKRDLLVAAKNVDKPLVHYLAAARSAYELGMVDETHRLLQQAEKSSPDHELAIALSQAKIQLLDEKYEQCQATLLRVKPLADKHPVVLDLLRQVYIQLQDWDSLVQLLPEIKASKIDKEKFQKIEEQAFVAFLSNIKKASRDGDFDQVESAWQSIPTHLHKNTAILACHVKSLIQYKKDDLAEPLVRKALKSSWDSQLVTLYGLIKSSDSKTQLINAEYWLREHPNDTELLIALGRISQRNELWGKAKGYFEKSLATKETAEGFAQLAALHAHLGEHQESTALYQKGLMLLA